MLLKGTGSFLTTFFNSLCVFVGTGSSSEFLRAASDFQRDHLAPGAGPALCRIEIFWFTHVRFSRLQMAKKSHQREHDRFLKAQYSPCLPFPGVLPVTFRFLSLSQLEGFFPSKILTQEEKKKSQQQCIQSQAQLTPVWIWCLFPCASSNILAKFPFILCQFNFHLHFNEIFSSFPATCCFRLSRPTVRHLYMPNVSAANISTEI